MKFKQIDPRDIDRNVFRMAGDEWILVTAGTPDNFNMMTASWGTMGILWGRPVAQCFIRPQRYTFHLIDDSEYYTLSFYDEKYRPQLQLCGTQSGRDIDKVKETGFTPVTDERGTVYFEEANLVLICRKVYHDDFHGENIAPDFDAKIYPEKDYHRIYIGEIVCALKKEV